MLETVSSVWVGAVVFGALEWDLAAAPNLCVSVSNAASGGKVRECNSYLPVRPKQAPTHSCSPYSQYHTQHLSACVCLCVCVCLCKHVC